MNKTILSFALFLFSTLPIFSQTDFDRDTVIARLQKNIPAGWTMAHTDTLLVISRNRPVYRVPANHVNEPMYMHGNDSVTTDNDRPPIGAKVVEMKLIFSLKPRWGNIHYFAAERHNDSLNNKIEHLRKLRKSGGTVYRTKGKKGQMEKIQGDTAVDRFNNMLEDQIFALEKKKIDIPSYCSQYYVMREYATYYCTYPADDDPRYYSIFPSQAEDELNQIQDYVHNNCGSYWKYHKPKK